MQVRILNCPDKDFKPFVERAALFYSKELIPNTKLKFFIFSGSPLDSHNGWEWVKTNLKIDNVVYAENLSKYEQMCLMTLCSGHIIANSSFSWWGAWLSSSQKVVAPSGWFRGSNNEHLDTKDIIPESWNVI